MPRRLAVNCRAAPSRLCSARALTFGSIPTCVSSPSMGSSPIKRKDPCNSCSSPSLRLSTWPKRSASAYLRAQGQVLETQTSGELEFAYSDDAERAPALAHLTAAAVSGLPPCRLGMPPAGPERRARADRAPLRLAHAAGATITGPLCATDSGSSLHAATVASVLGASSSPCLAGRRDPAPARSAASTRRDDPVGKAAPLRYVLRRHAGTVLGASLRCAVSTPRHVHR